MLANSTVAASGTRACAVPVPSVTAMSSATSLAPGARVTLTAPALFRNDESAAGEPLSVGTVLSPPSFRPAAVTAAGSSTTAPAAALLKPMESVSEAESASTIVFDPKVSALVIPAGASRRAGATMEGVARDVGMGTVKTRFPVATAMIELPSGLNTAPVHSTSTGVPERLSGDKPAVLI